MTLKKYIFILERGERKERNTGQLLLASSQLGTWSTTQAYALTGNRTGDLSVHRMVLNPLSHTSQGR